MTTPLTERNKVFISYSHIDTSALKRLRVHLKPLEVEGFEIWDDTKIKPGQKWKEEIEKALSSAKIAVLLISPDFLASEFIANDELPPLLAAAEKEGVVIMPVILKPCRFTRTKILSQFQSVNSPENPLSSMAEAQQDSVWDKISKDIEAILNPL